MLLDIANEWFGRYSPSESLEYYFCNYTLLMYLCVERVDQIFDVLDKKRNAEIFRNLQKENFPTLRKINKWANFFKHPKEFLFSHWPTFFLEHQPPVFAKDAVIVNYDFIKNHYYSERKKRPEILQRNRAVYVEVPDLPDLTLHFCQEMNAFFEFICGNSIVVEYLRNISTIEVPYMEYGGEEYNGM